MEVADPECLRWAGGGESSEFNWFRDVEGPHGEDGRIAKYSVEVGCENDPIFKHDMMSYLADAGLEAVVCSTPVVSFSAVAGSGDSDRVDEHCVCHCECFLTAASDDVAVLDRGPVNDTNVYHVH